MNLGSTIFHLVVMSAIVRAKMPYALDCHQSLPTLESHNMKIHRSPRSTKTRDIAFRLHTLCQARRLRLKLNVK